VSAADTDADTLLHEYADANTYEDTDGDSNKHSDDGSDEDIYCGTDKCANATANTTANSYNPGVNSGGRLHRR
jgi:hypothetical protein